MKIEGNQDLVNEKLSIIPTGLATGIYFIKIIEGTNIIIQKILKL
jgi:hypothetical protein